MKKRSICILADPIDLQSAGIYRATREFINALHEYGENLDVTLIRQNKTGEYPKFKTINYPFFFKLPGFRFIKYFIFNPIVCNSKKYDFVMEPAHFGPFFLKRSIKRITFIHDLSPIELPELHNNFSSFLQRIFLPGILKYSNIILTNSTNSKRELHRLFPFTNNKVHILNFGIRHLPFPESAEDIMQKYNIDYPFFLFVGTIEPRKNLLTLLEAFRMYKEGPDNQNKLLIVGKKGWKTEAFDKALAAHPFRKDIIRPGFVPDNHLGAFYEKCTSFIFPSLFEGFGFPVYEALLHKAPCIIADNSNLSDIQIQGVIHFETMNASDLYEKMVSFNDRLTDEVVEKIDNEFNWSNCIRQFQKAIS